MELVMIGAGIWIALVALAVALCRAAGGADAHADGLYASERAAASDDVAPTGMGIRIPAL
jgi:hypothetical protein